MARRRALALIITTASLVGVTVSLNFPLLSLVLARHGYPPGLVGLNATANGLAVVLVVPVMRPLLLRFGARKVMSAGMVMAAAGMLLLPLWVDLVYWYGIRLLVGCGTALVFIVSEAAINALTPATHRGRILGLYATVFSVGYVAGPAIIAVLGSEGFAPFAASALLYVCGLLPAALARELDRRFSDGGRHGLGYLRNILARSPLAFLAIFVFGVVETAQFALMPLWGLALGRNEATTVLLLTTWVAGNILLQYPVGWVADRRPRRQVLAGCAGIATVVLLFLPALAAVEFLLWPTILMLGGIVGAIYTLALVLIGDDFRGLDLALANTVFVIMFQLGSILGPGYAGLAMGLIGAHGLPLALALSTGIVALFAARVAFAGRITGPPEGLPAAEPPTKQSEPW